MRTKFYKTTLSLFHIFSVFVISFSDVYNKSFIKSKQKITKRGFLRVDEISELPH